MTTIQDDAKEKSREPSDRFVAIALALILLFGAIVRFAGLNWDEDQHLHPDERFLTMVETSLAIPGATTRINPASPTCGKWGGYFDTACSPLSPYNHNFGFFVYGTFPIFLTRLVGEGIGMVGYGEIHLVGRALSAFFDLVTVAMIFYVGRRLYGTRVALLGAFFLAGSVLDIQQSHFFTVDTFTNVPILLAFWFALDIADGRGLRAFVLAGLSFGLALAGRINIAPFAAVLIAAALLSAYLQADKSRREFREATDPEFQPESSAETISRAFGALILCALAALITFRIFQPYAANGPNFFSPRFPKLEFGKGGFGALLEFALFWAGGANMQFIDNMNQISDFVSGKADFPPNHQWTDRPAYIFPLENILQWGLGMPLGIAACAGFLFAAYQLVFKREWKHLLIVLWVGITFLITGQQFAKTIRYFLQLYPFFALLAAYLIVTIWDAERFRIPARIGALLISILVIGYTAFWSIAFATIYVRPVSRVTASRWMIANIPTGSVIANEHWDDPLPLRVDGKDPFGNMFRGLKSSSEGLMQWYGEDTPEKRTLAINWLDETDYIVLSSNRLYKTIPRLPMRYPMTTKYYEWLFDGTLGFENIATFTSRPQLFGIEISDDDAEESFTVYDHPKALIFKKTPRYSRENTAALFNSINLDEVFRLMPTQATQAKTALMLTPQDWDAQLNGGTWRDIFDAGSWVNRVPVLVWLVMIEILSWIAFPIAFLVFRALRDRGFIFAKALGILVPAWGAWMLASFHLFQFSRLSILLIIALVAIASGLIIFSRHVEFVEFVRTHRRVLLAEEILYLVFFAAFLAIRFGNPDLWHGSFGGEKPMDFAYLNAVTKSSWFPPYDPWFAGGYINYYYFGQLITATLLRLSGILPEIAYNLALPMYFALTAMGAFSVVFNLVARRSAIESEGAKQPLDSRGVGSALLAALFVAVIGNLGELFLIFDTFIKMGGGDVKSQIPGLGAVANLAMGILRFAVGDARFEISTGWWYWNATRVIPDTINEFPFFTFLYADLHAHLMSLPFTLMVMGFGVNFILRERNDGARFPFLKRLPLSPLDVLEIAFASLVVGALQAINTWDYPTYLAVLTCALAIGEFARRRKIDLAGIISFGWRIGAIVALSRILFQPFIRNLATAYTSVEFWDAKRTSLGEYLTVHGIFLFIIATFLILQTFNSKASRGSLRFARLAIARSSRLGHMLDLLRAVAAPANWYQDLTTLVIALVAVIEVIFLVAQWYVFAFVFPLLVLAGMLVLRPDLDARARFVSLLVAAGLAMTMMVEVITLKGDIGRMNTVFKFYLQTWVFFGIAAAAGLSFMMSATDGRTQTTDSVNRSAISGRLPSWWWAVLVSLLCAGFLYPIFATRAKVNDRFVAYDSPGLNGMDFMNEAIYQDNARDEILSFDREAIDWLRANVDGSPMILEGNAPLYHWASRVSIYTGLPTVIGWDWHQKQQRSIIDGAIIDRRLEAVRNIYNTRDANAALASLKRFRVSYVYVGDVERIFYDPQGLAKFDAMARDGQLEIIYANERVKIYKIN